MNLICCGSDCKSSHTLQLLQELMPLGETSPTHSGTGLCFLGQAVEHLCDMWNHCSLAVAASLTQCVISLLS